MAHLDEDGAVGVEATGPAWRREIAAKSPSERVMEAILSIPPDKTGGRRRALAAAAAGRSVTMHPPRAVSRPQVISWMRRSDDTVVRRASDNGADPLQVRRALGDPDVWVPQQLEHLCSVGAVVNENAPYPGMMPMFRATEAAVGAAMAVLSQRAEQEGGAWEDLDGSDAASRTSSTTQPLFKTVVEKRTAAKAHSRDKQKRKMKRAVEARGNKAAKTEKKLRRIDAKRSKSKKTAPKKRRR